MADVHDKETRSYNMSRIRGKDTKPEMLMRQFLHANGFRFRLHVKTLPGKPDIVLPKYRTIIDIRGCFWHGHKNCKWGDHVRSKSKIMERVRAAVERDIRNELIWRTIGWNVIIVWDSCELNARNKKSDVRDKIFEEVLCNLRSSNLTKVPELKSFEDSNQSKKQTV